MIPDPREILYATAADQNHRMFLQVVTNAGNIGGYFCPVGKPNAGYLSKGGIGLFGGNCHYPGTNSPFLGAGMERRRLSLGTNLLPPEAYQLINSRHIRFFLRFDPLIYKLWFDKSKISPLKQAGAAAFSARKPDKWKY